MASGFSRVYEFKASIQSSGATISGIQGGWDRRSQDWNYELQNANAQLNEINDQIKAAQLRVSIAQDDQSNLAIQIQNAQAVEDFLFGKYTNKQLYSWMVDQTSSVFFQCYQMAYDLATRAEAAFRFERGPDDLKLHPVRVLGQPQEGAALRRAAVCGPQAHGDRLS